MTFSPGAISVSSCMPVISDWMLSPHTICFSLTSFPSQPIPSTRSSVSVHHLHSPLGSADPVKIMKMSCIIMHTALIFLFHCLHLSIPLTVTPTPEYLFVRIGTEITLATFSRISASSCAIFYSPSVSIGDNPRSPSLCVLARQDR